MITNESNICRLCRKRVPSQKSHVIPKLILKKILQECKSRNLFKPKEIINTTDIPVEKVQDLEKLNNFLCEICEKLFCGYETKFSENIYVKYFDDSSIDIQFDDTFLKFCVSVSWRILVAFQLYGKTREIESTYNYYAAEEAWRKYLLGESNTVGEFKQYMVLSEDFNQEVIKDSQYLCNVSLRYYIGFTIYHDVIASLFHMSTFALAKLGPFIIVGDVFRIENYGKKEIETSKEWRDFEVISGRIKSKKNIMPEDLKIAIDYFVGKTKKKINLNTLSESQRLNNIALENKKFLLSKMRDYHEKDILLFKND